MDKPISSRNQRSPVSRLPAEVLLNVFFTLRDIVMKRRYRKQDWTAIMHVCSLWRNVALDCRSLWTRIEYKPVILEPAANVKLDKINVFLKRSVRAEIRVKLTIRGSEAKSFFNLLRGEMWRVRELDLTMLNWQEFRGDFDIASLESCLSKMTQHAKNLKICNASSYYSDILTLTSSFPESIQLDSLSLNSVSVPWGSQLFINLSSLELEGIPLITDMRIFTFRDLVDILKSCPKLKTLCLKDVSIAQDVLVHGMERNTLNLPDLKRIVLHRFSFSHCLALFNLLTPSDTAFLDLVLREYPYHSSEHLHPKMLKWCEQSNSKTININLDESYFEIRPGCTHIGDCDEVDASSCTTIQVSTDSWSMPDSVTNSIAFLLGDPFWKSASGIVITFGDRIFHSYEFHMDVELWTILLNSLPVGTVQLKIRFSPECRLYNESIIGLIDALSRILENNEFVGSDEYIRLKAMGVEVNIGIRLPELEEITICCTTSQLENLSAGERDRRLIERMQNSTHAGHGRGWKLRFSYYASSDSDYFEECSDSEEF